MHRTQLDQQSGPIKESQFADISVALLPVIRGLRRLGCCPLIIRKDPQLFQHSQMKVAYSFKLISFPTVCTIVLIFIYTIASSTIIVQYVYYGRYRGLVNVSSSKTSNEIDRLFGWALGGFIIIYYIWLFLNPMLTSIRSNRLTEFLGQIPPFCQKFETTFQYDKVNFSKSRKAIERTQMSNRITGLIFISIIFYMHAPCLFLNTPLGMCQTSPDMGLAWFSFAGIVLGIVISFYQDTLLTCLLYIVENMLSEVERAIKHYGSKYSVNSKNLSNWVTLGRLVKTQADNLSAIIGPWELGTLFFNFITSILFMFMVVNSSHYAKVVLGSAAFFCVGNIVRLHIKTISEHKIRKVEKRIRRLIVNISPMDFRIGSERSLLSSVMACKPIEFHLCNLIVLDSRVTIWLIGGVVTYLMVLIQFQELNGWG